jgi:hypothetical protein
MGKEEVEMGGLQFKTSLGKKLEKLYLKEQAGVMVCDFDATYSRG